MAQRGQNRLECLAMIYEKNLGLIHQIAQPLVRPGIELDDLLQEAYFAILKAVDQYDEQQDPLPQRELQNGIEYFADIDPKDPLFFLFLGEGVRDFIVEDLPAEDETSICNVR